MSAARSSHLREEVPFFADRYEELRRCALHQNPEGKCAVGMALFVRSGMAAWMEACEALPRPGNSPRIRPTATERFVPDGLCLQVASLLADMALSVHARGAVTS